MTDAEILDRLDDAYEYAVWAADLGMIDFDPFAGLAAILRELRVRQRNAAGLTGWPSWPMAVIGWTDVA